MMAMVFVMGDGVCDGRWCLSWAMVIVMGDGDGVDRIVCAYDYICTP